MVDLSIIFPLKVADGIQISGGIVEKVGGVDKVTKKCYISFVTYL